MASDQAVETHGNDDPRRERTRRRLAQAVLALAGEHDITLVSVADLTRLAGINRATFYAHANSPLELLTQVLSAELDSVRQHTMAHLERDGMLFRDLTRRALHEILDHVTGHASVYGGAVRTSSMFALRVVLAEHIEESVLLILRKGFVAPPSPDAQAARLYAAFIAHGIAGAVEAWLHLPAPRDREALLDAIEAAYPSWYAPESGPPVGAAAKPRTLATRAKKSPPKGGDS